MKEDKLINNMKILYGTTNRAKLKLMRDATAPLNIDIICLDDLEQSHPEIVENGKNPLENAEIKARAYYKSFSMPVFSCDSGLYFDGLDEALQPGTYVRRVNGRELTDEEMLVYYSKLARENRNKLIARYRNAIFLIFDENTCFSSMDISIASEPFILTSVPHEKREKGFPLDSLSLHIETGKYYYDLTERTTLHDNMNIGLGKFFENALSKFS